MVDATGDFATTNSAAQRQALAVGRKPQMRHAVWIVNDMFAQQILPSQDLVVGLDLDPIPKAFGAIAWQVGATCAAGLTVVTHATANVLSQRQALGRHVRRVLRPSG